MNLIKGIVIFLFMLHAAESFSSDIICKYKYEMNEVQFSNPTNINSLDKKVENNGIKYIYHIENTSSFSEVDDYVVMENKKGYHMTYALNCSFL